MDLTWLITWEPCNDHGCSSFGGFFMSSIHPVKVLVNAIHLGSGISIIQRYCLFMNCHLRHCTDWNSFAGGGQMYACGQSPYLVCFSW
jgi:hypothetical protein